LFSVAAERPASAVRCPHCRNVVTLATAPTNTAATTATATAASRWYYARANKKKYGPCSWQQLLGLAQRGDLVPEDMLMQEGTRQWVSAGSMRALFGQDKIEHSLNEGAPAPATVSAAPAVTAAPPQPKRSAIKAPAKRFSRRLIAVAAMLCLGVVLGGSLLVGKFFSHGGKSEDDQSEEQLLNPDSSQSAPDKTSPGETPQVTTIPPSRSVAVALPKEKAHPQDKKLPAPESPQVLADQFLLRVNRYRKNAGLGSVSLDVELSIGCRSHAQYVMKNFNPQTANLANLAEEPGKPGFSKEGQAAGTLALVAFAEPGAALDRWMGRLADRLALLNAETQTIGLGFERNAKGEWICVCDPVRGAGESVVIYPAPNQQDVPLAFSGGPELTDAKATGGYPVTVTFAPARTVTEAAIELRDDRKKSVAAWTWTPDKPLARGNHRNTIALIPKELLRSNHAYEVLAKAKVDGKPWSKVWRFISEDDSDSKGLWARKALAKVNAYRHRAGLAPVQIDDKLSAGCLAHARYLVLNADHSAILGLGAHDENEKLPGFTEEGRRAGKSSDIAIGDYEPLDGVDAWMATLYHRVTILEPNLRTIGFACVRGKRLGWNTVLNVVAGRQPGVRPHPVYYPVPDQNDVPLNFPNGGEEPNPIPLDKDGRAGYPITATFPDNDLLKNATGKLTLANGTEVPSWMSSPDKPANPQYPRHQGSTVCLIAKDPLEPNTTYVVYLQGQRGGKPWKDQWKFTTGESGQTAAQASRRVLDRLNQARAQAGLGPVIMDESLRRGCQKHADYLVMNAEELAKRNSSVNEEDPLMPGYTLEGAQAARHADVFSNAPIPVTQIDDLLATYTRRVYLLDPKLQRLGFGCAHDVGRGWRCVLDLIGGRGDRRVILSPAPREDNVPCASTDRISEAPGAMTGFPVAVIFPKQTTPRNVAAVLTDAKGEEVPVWLSTPAKSFIDTLPPQTIALHPRSPLRPGQTYSVTVSAVVGGAEWRETWQFTTKK
jgi:uncharacterized protein YkwD